MILCAAHCLLQPPVVQPSYNLASVDTWRKNMFWLGVNKHDMFGNQTLAGTFFRAKVWKYSKSTMITTGATSNQAFPCRVKIWFAFQRSTGHKYAKQHRETGKIGPLLRKYIRTPRKVSFANSLHLMWTHFYEKRKNPLTGLYKFEEVFDVHLTAILANLARTQMFQMFRGETCHICNQLEHVFRHLSTLRWKLRYL